MLHRVFSHSQYFRLLSSLKPISFRAMSTAKKEQTEILNWASKDGEFRRQQSVFRDQIVDEPGAKFAPERYIYIDIYLSVLCVVW